MPSGPVGTFAVLAQAGQPPLAPGDSGTPQAAASPGVDPMPEIPGWATVSTKLLKKIWSLDFIDMWELLPESWHLDQQAEGCCRSQHRKRGLVTNLALWTECYAVPVALLSVRYPSKTPHFMAYLRMITRASRNFEGVAWATYMAYRRLAASHRSLDWAVSDTALYNEAFTGWAKLIRSCIYCLADSHESKDCTFAPEESATTPRPSRPPQTASARSGTGMVEVCMLFNKLTGSQCRFKLCRYAHICSKCRRGGHSASECEPQQQKAFRNRSRSPGRRPAR